MENFLCNNIGQRSLPHPGIFSPVAASGIKVTCTTGDTNYTTTVKSGAFYRVVVARATSYAAVAASLSTIGDATVSANVEWVFAITGDSGAIHIPLGKTTLNITATYGGTFVFLVELGT